MDLETLTRVRLHNGTYEGLYQGPPEAGIEALHEGRAVATARLVPDEALPGRSRVALDLPATIIGEGVQVVALRSTVSGEVLDRVTLMAGAPLDDDIRAELALMRQELEMLKSAFRRHCTETARG